MFDFLTALYPAKDLANIKKVSCSYKCNEDYCNK